MTAVPLNNRTELVKNKIKISRAVTASLLSDITHAEHPQNQIHKSRSISAPTVLVVVLQCDML